MSRQVKKRGPFLSLEEFVNRQLSTDKELAARGALQAALDDPTVDVNKELKYISNEMTQDKAKAFYTTIKGTPDGGFPEAAVGYSGFAAPGWVTQADLLRPMAPYITPRSDTFRIRGYGESVDANGKVARPAHGARPLSSAPRSTSTMTTMPTTTPPTATRPRAAQHR